MTAPPPPSPARRLTTPAAIALGSNLGDRDAHLRRALAAVQDLPGIDALRVSGFYETDPVGPQDQGRFLNAAAVFATSLPPAELLTELLDIERRLGRPAREDRTHWGPREIDLDLLLYGDQLIDRPGLTLPHPRLHERWFVLQPLADVAADWVHPGRGQTIAQLLAALPQEAHHG